MRKFLLTTVSGLLSLLLLAAINEKPDTMTEQIIKSPQITVMSYNIRYDTPSDGINAWPHRKDKVAEMIGQKYQSDIVGLQEALKSQIDELEEQLPEFAWVGMGRADGKDAGEFSPIFYKKDRFEVLEDNTFWLSETPDVPGSVSWDSAITRVVTWARFREKNTDLEFIVFNTHFDHRGEQARIESARMLVSRVSEVPENIPVIITGDLNVPESSEVYDVLTGAPGLMDARYASQTEHEGPTATFNSWDELRPPGSRIDYILVRGGVGVLNHRFLDDRYDGRFPSDHLPVISDIVLN
ncbi:MAG: endonuclease/exonuclease/phosphatase family protein [Balneolales bacterium]